MLKALWALPCLLVCFTASAQVQKDWIVTKTEWSAADEAGFGEFVKALAKTKCSNVDECLRSSANPYRNTDPTNYKFWSDCADFPYFLRAYYAWKNQLPFSYVSAVGVYGRRTSSYPGSDLRPFWDISEDPFEEDVEEEWEWERVVVRDYWGRERYEMRPVRKKADIRYSPNGNYPSARRRVAPSTDGSRLNFMSLTDQMQNTVSSGTFRFRPGVRGSVDSDFYPVDINREAVRPGAVAYSPMGHVSIVYDVTPDGRILLFNAHPADRSRPGSATPVSRTTFETRKEYVRSRPEHGSGLKQWRPFRLVGARWKGDRYVGGKFVFTQDRDLPHYSAVQFYGTNQATNHNQAQFVIGGRKVSYETFIRLRLASSKLDPLRDFERLLADACELFRGRVGAVQDAVDAGLPNRPHPSTLPANIFSAEGDWENYSSPSRDTRLRSIFANIRDDLLERISAIRNGDPTVIRYPDLRAKLLGIYGRFENSCSITYKNTAGRPVTLSFSELVNRLTLISFDPYHCVERRWGATSQAELATCRDNANKKTWYNAQQIVRNYLNKDWKASGPIDITDLQQGRLGFGKPKKPDLDVKSFVQRLPETL